MPTDPNAPATPPPVPNVVYVPAGPHTPEADAAQRSGMLAAARAGHLVATPPRPWMRQAGWIPSTNFMGAPDDHEENPGRVEAKLAEIRDRCDPWQLETIRANGERLSLASGPAAEPAKVDSPPQTTATTTTAGPPQPVEHDRVDEPRSVGS